MNNVLKKILFFTSGSVGGAERVTLTIAKMLPQNEYEVKIIHICKEIKNLDKFVPDKYESHHIKIRNIWDFTTSKLVAYMKKERPFAVFSSLNYLNVRVILAAKIAKVPKIIIRNNIGWSHWDKVTKLLAKLTYPLATHIISQTEEMQNELFPQIRQSKCQWQVIPNPIDFDTITEKIKNCENPYNVTNINYVYVGRIDSVKGLDVLLQALKNVVTELPNAFLTIVGDYNQNKDYYESLRNMAMKSGLTDYIKFVGFQDNPYRYIRYASCFVLPSRNEGNPNVLHEAMWLNVPVVATNSVPVISRIVTPERGDIVNVDDIDGLGQAMLKRINKPINIPYNYTNGQVEFISLFN